MKIFYKTIIYITQLLKPLLLKIFPYQLLRKLKGKVISRSFTEIENVKRRPFDRLKYEDGVNLIGDIRAESGLGQSCRLVAAALKTAVSYMDIYQYDTMGKIGNNKVTSLECYMTQTPKYNVNLVHINPHELGIAYLQMDDSIWNDRYNIAYWLWELEEFPDEWTPCFQCVDEIWAPSEFICDAIRKKTDLPVKCMPYHVEVTMAEEYGRREFDLPEDKFLFLMMYDHSSGMERKNPLGVLQAFKTAFEKENKKVGLVIKVSNATQEDEEQIGKILSGYENIYFIKEILDRDKVNSLTKCVDVVVSLHRAEGFGLVLAEAMLLGTPTIATNWSSNTEFMNEEVGCMVDYELITIEKDMPPFKAGNRWANPNIEQAAEYMKKLYEDKTFYQQISVNAKGYAEKVLSMEHAAGLMKKRLDEIYQESSEK